MRKLRRILCTHYLSLDEQGADVGLWVLPYEIDWTSHSKSFDLLGSTCDWDHLSRQDVMEPSRNGHGRDIMLLDCDVSLRDEAHARGSERMSGHRVIEDEGDGRVREKFLQLLQSTWRVFEYQPKTIDEGVLWVGTATAKRLLAVAKIFALLEKSGAEGLNADVLWQHSVRTGCLAGFLAKDECGDSEVMMQSCVAGYAHDIGLAILVVSLGSSRYWDVMLRARQESLTLATAELLELGLSHETVGAEYLQRQAFPKAIVGAVAFHDNPLGLESSGFSPTVAVYAANTLDGGGWPHDSDGVPSDRAMEYLSGHGYVDPWPKWQRQMTKVQRQELGHA